MPDDRFIMLQPGGVRPGRLRLPPAFAVKAMTEDTEGRFSLMEVTLGKSMEIPRHTHHHADECIYVLDGKLAIEVGGQRHTATKGMFLLLPHGVPHRIRCASTPPPRVLQISSPGGWEHYLEDLLEAGPSIFTAGRPDPAKINPIAAKYGIHYEEPQDQRSHQDPHTAAVVAAAPAGSTGQRPSCSGYSPCPYRQRQ